MRVAHARVLVAEGETLAAVARVMQISRQAVYRTPKPRRSPQRRPVTDPVDVAIVETAKSYPTAGYRMVCCFARRQLGVAVNRKRVLRVMREQKLIQRRPVEARRPHSRLDYRTPREVRTTWDDATGQLQKLAA